MKGQEATGIKHTEFQLNTRKSLLTVRITLEQVAERGHGLSVLGDT